MIKILELFGGIGACSKALEAILTNLLLENNAPNDIEGQTTIYDFIND